MVLLDIDPRRLHAYWTLTPAEMAAAHSALGGGTERRPMVLRLHDVAGEGAGAPFDVEVQGLQSRQYVDLFEDGRSYEAELGLLRADGSLVCLARSNRVDMPRLSPSDNQSFNEATPGDFPEVPADRPAADEPAMPETESRDFPEVDREDLDEGAERAHGAEKMVEESFPEVAADDLEEYAALAQDRLDRFADEVPGAPTAEALVQRHEPPPGDSGGIGEGEAKAGDGALPLETVMTYSSFEMGRESVDLEVHAEIHVYGRAKPGRKLTLFGRPVALRPDGTFSVRRPLPDGAAVLPLTVTTEEDGEG